MQKQLLVASLILFAILVVYNISPDTDLVAFEEWKDQYGANWVLGEEAYRRLIFEKNLIQIKKHNADQSHSYKKGVNQFSIFTTEEFVTKFLAPMSMVPTPQVDEIFEFIGNVDWTTKGGVSLVKNQGACGSGWAFSTTGALESSFLIEKKLAVLLSEQQLVDCTRPQRNQGCNGGWPADALNYIQYKGIATQSQYPYVATEQACKIQGGSTKIHGKQIVNGCPAIINAIHSRPISVTVDAAKWATYKSGVFSDCATSVNHAVLLVGIVGGAWKIKNSWGVSWGESGYIRLAEGNTCGICSFTGVYPSI